VYGSVGLASVAITFTSRLPLARRKALEDLLFFNGQQARVRNRIVESIESYGLPEIVESEEALRIRLSGRDDAQSLFALTSEPAPELAGAVVYVRDRRERFVVVHIAVADGHASDGPYAAQHVLLRMLTAVRAAAAVTTGVRMVDFFYGQGKARSITVRKPSDNAR
jgi:hypothetical protein